jgi:acetyl esterase
MPVHPQVQEILDAGRDLPPPSSVEEAREQYSAGCMTYVGMAEPVERVADEDADGVPVRVYVPKDADPDEALPCVVWIHGGGWILGTIDAYDSLCRALCNGAGCVVVSVDYRLAPEHQHPTQVADCCTALRWVLRGGPSWPVDSARVAVAGDSAGGNLAAVAARRLRSDLVFQVLVYPAVDARCSTSSYDACGGDDYGLSRDHMKLCWAAYAPDAAEDPDVSPLRAPDLAGLPPALVICAEYDPLRDEGLSYAERLREAGVDARSGCYDGMVHGFFRWRGGVDAAHEAMEQAAAALREAFALAPRK